MTRVCLDLLSLVNSLHTLVNILTLQVWQYCYVDTSITPLPTNFLAGDDVRVELLLEGEWQPEDGDGVVHGLLEAAANHR